MPMQPSIQVLRPARMACSDSAHLVMPRPAAVAQQRRQRARPHGGDRGGLSLSSLWRAPRELERTIVQVRNSGRGVI